MTKNKLTTKIPLPVPALALSKPGALTCEVTCSQSSWWSAQNSREKIEFYKEKTTACTNNGFQQAQGHKLWAYMLIIKLMVSSKLSWENKFLQGKKPLLVPAVALSKHKAISYELKSSETSWWSPQNSSETKIFIKKKTTAGSGSGLEQAQGHQLWAHKLRNKLMVTPKFKWKENKFIKKKNTAGTGSGFEQA
jgi:hypothetical protein